jgi:hypothetical protein
LCRTTRRPCSTQSTRMPSTRWSRPAPPRALAQATLRREVRRGRLRVSKRAGRYYVLGAWLLEWLRTGEIRRRCRAAEPGERVVAVS